MRAWQIPAGCPTPDQIEMIAADKPVRGAGEVLIRVNAFIVRHQVKPLTDRQFDFADAHAAYAYQSSADLFGKVVIANPGT